MKKLFALIFSLVLIFSVSSVVFADNNLEDVSAYVNYGITIRYNGDAQTMYDANGGRVYPLTYNGSTYLPVRAVSAMLSVPVRWDGENNTVWLGEGESVAAANVAEKPELMANLEDVSAFLNYGITIRYNGNEQTMYDANNNRVYPITYNGTTYLPVRAVSTLLSVAVNWDGKNNTVWLGKVPAGTVLARGEKLANKYESAFLGIGFNLPALWAYQSDEKVHELLNVTFTGDFVADLHANGSFGEMMAVEQGTGFNVNILLAVKNDTARDLTFEGLYQHEFDALKVALNKAYDFSIVTKGSLEIEGKSFYAIDIYGQAGGTDLYQKCFLVDCGDYYATITATTTDEQKLANILKHFYLVK